MTSKSLAAVLALLLMPVGAHAAESRLQLELTTQSGDFENRVVNYDCGAETPVQVTYINAAPNFLAIVPIAEEPQPLVFASVISGSGARYAAGAWIWWSKGVEASLYDAMADEDAPAVLTCTEINNTP